MKTFLRFVWVALIKIQRIVMLFTIVFCTLAIFSQAVMRYVFHSPFVGIEEMGAYFAFWLYFIGASYGSYERSHIRAELTHLFFGTSKKYALCRAATSFISFGTAAFAIPWAYDYVLWGIMKNEQSRATFLGSTYPVFWFQASILVGLALMAFYFFVEFIQWVRIIAGKDQIPEEMIAARKEVESWI
ncbi:TRAP transporter small permease [Aminivibrio sp.]|uniref:TRAP transporter small permease n=1 Tax=Aminivibrio sp. TaxID=1872489 RepID=UPI00345E20E1